MRGHFVMGGAPGRNSLAFMANALRGVLLGAVLSLAGVPVLSEEFKAPSGMADDAVSFGADLDGDGDPDEIELRLEVIEIVEEVSPGEVLAFWVFSPVAAGMTPVARLPSPTIRVEQGDRVRVVLENTHYFPHTIHFHGTIHPNAMDGVPEITQSPTLPGQRFVYEFVAQNPGTHFYHCHVQADVHVRMGLAGMFIIEPNEPDNNFAPLVIGAGAIQDLSTAVAEDYATEHSLVYSDVDSDLHRLPLQLSDPREIEWRMHRDYDSTAARPDLFLLNGRSFPFTLLDTPIDVTEDGNALLRVLNAGERMINLHTHGHHPVLKARDGMELSAQPEISRDTFSIGAAQRLDLELRTTEDGAYSSGPGVWLMHDHTEKTVSNRGINPGGDITTIIYEGFRDESTGLPDVPGDLSKFFDSAYYRGEVPVFPPEIFGTTAERYGEGWSDNDDGPLDYARRSRHERIEQIPDVLASHRVVAERCTGTPRGSRRILIRGGTEHAGEGEVFGFEPRQIRVGRCEEVELVFANADEVRHALMVPGLNPMVSVEFTGTGVRKVTFMTPDEDVTLEFHCHVETHEKMGMVGQIIVGSGGSDEHGPEHDDTAVHGPASAELFEGVGKLISVDTRRGRVVVDHEEIEGFMGAMTMSFTVDPREQILKLVPGTTVHFVIDPNARAIVSIEAHRPD